MALLSLEPGSHVLIEQDCLRMRGALGLQGRLSLTEEALVFVVSGLDRLIDDEVWRLALVDIASTTLERGEPEVSFTTKSGQIHRFTGTGAERVLGRYEALLLDRGGHARPRLSFVPGEQVLVQGGVNLLVEGAPPATGQLALTNRRLRFEKGKHLSWNDEPDVELALASIEKIARVGMKSAFTLVAGGKNHSVMGPDAVSIYAWLMCMLGAAPAHGALPATVLLDVPADLSGGLLASPGQLLVSTDRLVFVVRRLLEPLVGVKDVVLGLEELCSLELIEAREGDDGRLTVAAADRSYVLHSSLGAEQLDTLVDAVCGASAPTLDDPAALLNAWGVALDEDDALEMVQPVLLWKSSRQLVRAWLVVTRAHGLVLPIVVGDVEKDAIVFESARLDRAERDHKGDLVVPLDDGPLRLSAVGTPLDVRLARPSPNEPEPDALAQLNEMLEARREGALEPVSLPAADLRGVELSGADLVCAELAEARLDRAILSGALLIKAVLTKASLRGADLNGADLTGADLAGAVLAGARVEGASLADVDARGAHLGGLLGEPSSVAGMLLDLAAAERSGLSDGEVIQLWTAGVEIADLDRFGDAVRHACTRPDEVEDDDDAPSPRELARLELDSRRELAIRMSQPPPPPAQWSLLPALGWLQEVEVDDAHRQIVRISSMPPPVAPSTPMPAVAPRTPLVPAGAPRTPGAALSLAPLSMRSIRLVASEPPAEALAAGWNAGDVLLGVTLERRLSDGNAAACWLGNGEDGTQLVVKIFDAARHGYGLMAAAFRRGVRAMNRLQSAARPSPHVAPLHAVSVNRLAFAMPYASIGSAVDLPLLKWSPPQLVAFFEQVCRAVGFAHGEGVLHRGLRPANILLGDDFAPLVADFDMVDLPSLANADDSAGGYRAYAAPEELLGNGTQSPSADVYSLGRVLHYLLLGEHPKEHISDVPQLPSLEGAPEGLIRIVRKCTVRAPASRYQQVSELLADLTRWERAPSEVGLAGAAPLPVPALRPAGLPEQRAWLGADRAREPAKRPPPRAGVRRPQPAAESAVLTRGARNRVGLAGALVMVAALVSLVPTAVPDEAHLIAVRWAAAVGAALLAFFIPRVESRPKLGTFAFPAFFFLLALTLDAGRLSVFRVRAALHEGDPVTRARAVRALVEIGESSFDGVNLAEVDLKGAYLSKRSFKGADLSKANLTAAVLYQTNFEGANLAGAKLDGAAAVESGFDGADLTGALIRRTNLTHSTAYQAKGWDTAICNDITKMPRGWACIARHPKPD